MNAHTSECSILPGEKDNPHHLLLHGFRSYLIPHRREGGGCPRCDTELRKEKVSGRTAYFCPHCQTDCIGVSQGDAGFGRPAACSPSYRPSASMTFCVSSSSPSSPIRT